VKEIPQAYVLTNQWAIVLLVAVSVIFQEPWVIVFLWAVQLVGRLAGMKANLFIFVLKPLLKPETGKSQAAELFRFNSTIGLSLLTLSVISFVFGWHLAGYIFALMVAVAAFAAILGFCIGCVIYYQYKQWKRKRRA
jgi:membrane associated rhomboid family serine protease